MRSARALACSGGRLARRTGADFYTNRHFSEMRPVRSSRFLATFSGILFKVVWAPTGQIASKFLEAFECRGMTPLSIFAPIAATFRFIVAAPAIPSPFSGEGRVRGRPPQKVRRYFIGILLTLFHRKQREP
jgi:hypothetical protein